MKCSLSNVNFLIVVAMLVPVYIVMGKRQLSVIQS